MHSVDSLLSYRHLCVNAQTPNRRSGYLPSLRLLCFFVFFFFVRFFPLLASSFLPFVVRYLPKIRRFGRELVRTGSGLSEREKGIETSCVFWLGKKKPAQANRSEEKKTRRRVEGKYGKTHQEPLGEAHHPDGSNLYVDQPAFIRVNLPGLNADQTRF